MRGFTLLELLSVLAALAILAAVAAAVLPDRPSDLVVLKRSEWECLRSVDVIRVSTRLVGKIPVESREVQQECVEWLLRR